MAINSHFIDRWLKDRVRYRFKKDIIVEFIFGSQKNWAREKYSLYTKYICEFLANVFI